MLLVYIILLDTSLRTRTRGGRAHVGLGVHGTALRDFIGRLRGTAKFSFVCKRRMGLARHVALRVGRGGVDRVLRHTFRGRPVAFRVSKGRVLLRGQPIPRGPIDHGFAVDKCIASKTSSRALVNTGVLRDHHSANATAGPFNFCSLALPRKRARLIFSCLNCRDQRDQFRLAGSALLGIELSDGGRLTRIIILSSGQRTNVRDATVKTRRVPVARVERAPSVLKRTSLLGAVRLVPNIRTNVRNFTNVCIQKKNPSRGLIVLSKVPICGTSRLLKMFSVFAPRTMGGAALFGDSFPTHCNKHLSSVMSMQAGSKSVRGCRNTFDVNLLASGLRVRNPV